MASERAVRRYRTLYSWLLKAAPRAFRERFGQEMELTFLDLCRERARAGRGLHTMAWRSFADTGLEISKQQARRAGQMRKGVALVIAVTGLILTIPAVAMRYSDEVNWTAFDFIVAGTLLMTSGLTAEYLWRKTPNVEYRAGSLLAVFTGLFVIWVNLAVGIIGNEDHPANEMYGLVLLIGAIGAFISRLRPAGMAVAMNVTAIALAAVPLVAYCIWKPPLDIGLLRTVIFNSFIALSFGISARLYRTASGRMTGATHSTV